MPEPVAPDRRRARWRRGLQVTLAVFGIIPIVTGIGAVVLGPESMPGGIEVTPSIDNEYRFLGVFWFACGVMLYWTIPRIERVTLLFRFLGCIIVAGGLVRLASLLTAGTPEWPYYSAIIFELTVVPATIVWQGLIADT